MRRFAKEVLIFTVLLFLTITLIKRTVPYYYGNELIRQKIEYLKSHPGEFDTYFIGSSGIYRHIIPDIFDGMTGKKSFNLGAPSMFSIETSYILENFLKENTTETPVDYYLTDFHPGRIVKRNLHTIRAKYFLDMKRLRLALGYYIPEKNYTQARYHLLSFTENVLGIGVFIPILKYHFSPFPELEPTIVRQKGFYAVDQELKELNPPNLIRRNNNWQKAVATGTKERKEISPVMVSTVLPEDFYFKVKTKNAVFYQITGNPITEDSLRFDKGHYTFAGAQIYTRLASQAIVNLGK